MTYRERRENRVERLREWAAKREARATAVLASHEVFRGDIAFNTQPGHMPFRARVIAQDDQAYESLRKAEGMEHRASGIEDQLASSIYSDDPDAIEQLQVRIAGLEAQRARLKAYNVTVRKRKPDLALLTDGERERVESAQRFFGGTLAYPLANLGADITRNRERLAHLKEART